jgi:hypothetical protein
MCRLARSARRFLKFSLRVSFRARVASEESLFKQEGVPDEDRDSSPLLRLGMTDCSNGELTHDHRSLNLSKPI